MPLTTILAGWPIIIHIIISMKKKIQRHFLKSFFKIAACELRIQFQKTGHKQTTYKCLPLTPEITCVWGERRNFRAWFLSVYMVVCLLIRLQHPVWWIEKNSKLAFFSYYFYLLNKTDVNISNFIFHFIYESAITFRPLIVGSLIRRRTPFKSFRLWNGLNPLILYLRRHYHTH